MRTNPESGEKVLLVNPGFTTGFRDITEEESEPILWSPYGVATEYHNIWRHRWSPAMSSNGTTVRTSQ